MRSRKKHIDKSQTRTGALTVEVALCIPVLLMIFFACYEIGRANMILHATESAAYEGARVGIIPGTTPEKIRSSTSQILRTIGVSDFRIEVIPDVIDNDTPEVQVRVSVPLRNNMALPGIFFEDPTFTGSTTLSRETK